MTEFDWYGAIICADIAGCGSIQKPPRESTSRCVPYSSSSWLQPPFVSVIVSISFGVLPVTSTASSWLPLTVNSVLPFVFTMSGSSTPCSWTFVPE